MPSNPQFWLGVSIILLGVSSLIHSSTEIRMSKRIHNLHSRIELFKKELELCEKSEMALLHMIVSIDKEMRESMADPSGEAEKTKEGDE